MAETYGIVLAAGSAKRMGENKMFINIGSKSVLERSLDAFKKSECFDHIIIVCQKKDENKVKTLAKRALDIPFTVIRGGSERQFSVENALNSIKNADVVLVHDGARCFIQVSVIKECVKKAYETGAAAAGVKTKDTIKTTTSGAITGTVDRSSLVNIQTPQAFSYSLLMDAHKKAKTDGFVGTDECSLLERLSVPISFVQAHYDNIKVTTQEDVLHGKHIAGTQIRTGTGYDAHRLEDGLPLILGGVKIEHTHGLLGHSDADVLIHAVMDALFGAAAMGDIGKHFPCTDEFAGISSIALLKRTRDIISRERYGIVNIDATVVMEQPKLSLYIEQMRTNIADALGLDIDCISVKATTTEGLGFEGQGQGISAMAAATLER